MLVAGIGATDHEPRLQRMRLGIEVTTCTASRTGVGYYTEHLVDALLQTRGADDEVVLLSNRPPAPELQARWSRHLHVGGVGVRALWMQADLPRMLSDAGVDVGVFPNYAVPLASPCPSIVVVHDLALLRTPQHFTLRKRLLLRPMLEQSVASSAVVATVSETSQREIVELLGVPPSRIEVLPCAPHPSCRPVPVAVSDAVRARHGLTRDYVLTVGTLEPRKNLLTVLRAWDRLAAEAPAHDLVVVGGRGWHDRELVRALEARGASRRVRWLGYVSEPDLVALYSAAEAFVFVPTLEGFGMPVLEAMACGTPVVASDIAALREIGGDVARFVDPGDDASLAGAILQALGDVEGSEAARAAGLAHAARFSWKHTAEALWARARAAGPARVPDSAKERAAAPAQAPTLPPSLSLPPPGLDAREWALLATVVYADLFNSPLPVQQATTSSFGFTFEEAEVRSLARGPGLSPLLTLHPDGYLVLAGREALADPMPEREALTRSLLDRNRGRLSALAALPFVRSLVISGGIAHRNPGARPDVDLFVVAAAGRAYTAYTMFFLATKLTGTRHLICPNYMVDESELPIVYHRDVFTAHQLLSSRPFVGQRTYEALCRANEGWVRRLFPGFAPREQVGSPRSPFWQHTGELALWPAAPALEASLRWAWRFRLRRRAAAAPRADVVLADGILKLHLSDYRRTVLERLAARLEAVRAQLGSAPSSARAGLEPVGT
jgi:glycosyltransferase involved in cell wall biosynthesis